MTKMRYFNNKFSKITESWRLSAPSAPLTSDFGDLKLRDFPKLWFFKRILMKSKLKKSPMRSFQWRHRYYVNKTSQNFSSLGPSPSKFLATPVATHYALE